jgi:CHRD domain
VKKLILVAAAVSALAVAGVAQGKGGVKQLSASLNARQEIPKQAVSVPNAIGTFSGTLRGQKLTWKLTFKRLSGKALQAHIHVGARGKMGNVLVALCAPCRSGMTKTTVITRGARNTIERGSIYVNVHTAKNPAGEIRGQVKVIDA